MYEHIQKEDKEIYDAIEGEEKRQAEGLELIASENYVSKAVREALGSVFTNKYAEGYPGKRYYGGQEFTDAIERTAIERAKKLFGADHANVQPLSGAPANVAVYMSWLSPGDTVLGLHLEHGGHLTHGAPVTYMAQLFNFVRYKMKDVTTGVIDYDEMREVAKKEKPKIILVGASAYSRDFDYAKVREIADEVGALAMADIAHTAGLIAAGLLKNPFDHGFNVVTTTTHKTLRGPRGGMILSKGVVGNPLKAVEKTVENLPTLIDRMVFPGFQGGPHMNVIAAKAIAFHEAAQPSFKQYAKQVIQNAKAMEEVFRRENIPMIGGGTSNHLLLVDVSTSLGIGGKEAQQVLDEVGLSLSRSTVPEEPRTAFDPSGIRIGTPAITTRGFKEKESARIAELILEVLRNRTDVALKEKIHQEVKAIAKAHPVPESFA